MCECSWQHYVLLISVCVDREPSGEPPQKWTMDVVCQCCSTNGLVLPCSSVFFMEAGDEKLVFDKQRP